MHLFTAICATVIVTLYVLSVKRLFAVQFSVNELDPVFLRTYLYFMNLYGLANGILYGILTVLLVAVTVLILRTMNNGSQYQILLRRMTVIFALSYGIRAIFLYFNGHYYRLIKNQLLRQIPYFLVKLAWDLPCLGSMLWLNYR